ncbi:flagellar hook-associated protein FlgL [Amphritea sp. 1_MG-2023]|uniref:flagellar hook-associated protein FlgL n=1 Tax=Amphritea sp. 1_MG-2023 TaxID=3062670 RepID=UPI0026E19B8E|nr:flagellar hook-associated protein FlgL [Amphritea sp. 1_MG-2023]MDO6564515.1 flagellar hook-associated protein FlgL [Amphritea sp. 1_MG-2023]
MRISTQQQYLTSINNMQQSQTRLASLQEQISTGKKLLNPSDDPVAAAQIVKLERELAQYEKYDDNINVTTRRLEMEETILDDINTAVDRMRELTVQAGSSVLADQDRASISQELYQLTDYVAGLMNTQDSEGEYLFAGSKGSTKPYTELSNGRYEYNGDAGQRSIQVGSDLFVPSNDSGQFLFEAVEGDLQINLTGQAVYDANLAATDPFVTNAAFADSAAEQRFQAATRGLGDLTIQVSEPTSGAYTYSVIDSGGQYVNDAAGNPLSNIAAGDLATTPLQVDLLGMQFELNAPADIANANEIKVNVTPETKNVLDIAMDLADVLATPLTTANKDAFNEAIATGLDQFEAAAERNIEARAVVGSRLKSLEYVSSSNLDFKLQTESAISSLEDADLADVISQFSLEEVTLQAAQATFSRISSLSLFDYLR